MVNLIVRLIMNAIVKKIRLINFRKNEKINNYLKKCDKCFLLIYLPDVSMGNYCHFTDELNNHKFHLNFEDVYLCKWNKIFTNDNFVKRLQ